MKKLLFILLTSLLVAVQNIAETPNAAQLSQKKLIKARPLPINDVRLLGGPLKKAQDLDAQYLLELEPNRMLAFLRQRAGLEPRAKPYGGWDGAGSWAGEDGAGS